MHYVLHGRRAALRECSVTALALYPPHFMSLAHPDALPPVLFHSELTLFINY